MSKVLVDRELPEPYGWIAVGELYMIRENAIRAAGKTSCIGVYTRPQLLAALSAVTAERDRLRELSVERILLDVVPGDGEGHEVYAKSVEEVEAALTAEAERAEALEAERDQLRAEVEALRKDAERYRWASSGVHEAETLVSIVNCHGGYAEKVAERVDVYREAAMAAKEA